MQNFLYFCFIEFKMQILNLIITSTMYSLE